MQYQDTGNLDVIRTAYVAPNQFQFEKLFRSQFYLHDAGGGFLSGFCKLIPFEYRIIKSEIFVCPAIRKYPACAPDTDDSSLEE
jgi:hypothetical protein